VVAAYATKEPMGKYTVSTAAYDANVTNRSDAYLLVSKADGVPAATARNAIEKVLAENPNATLRTKDEFKGAFAQEINQMLNLVYVLLAMAVLIALFGIANTLALSVYERTRELGLLRAIGAGRSQIRSAIRWESVLIALLGTTLGTGIGLGFGWALVEAMQKKNEWELAVPYGELGVIAVFATVAAMVAAALPARRAAKLDVLTSLGD
jgi:putative ABC transport system permease protein